MSRPPLCRRFWQDQFLAGYNKFPGGDEPTIGIDYNGRLFQVLGNDQRCGYGCWGMNTSTGFIEVMVANSRRHSGVHPNAAMACCCDLKPSPGSGPE